MIYSEKMCDIHGLYQSSGHEIFGKIMWAGCPVCIEVLKNKDVEKAEKIPWMSKRREGMRVENYYIQNDKQKTIKERVLKYIDNFQRVRELGSCLCFVGSPGTGKTHLATGIGYAVAKKGFSVGYERLYDLMLRIKNTYNRAVTDTEAGIIKALTAFDLLILDEVGLKSLTETEIALTYQVIDKRYEDVRPTVIVSNLNAADLESCLGSRTIDRLYSNHGAFFTFDWESQRRKTNLNLAA